jgi:hypothetical protein
LSATGRLSSVSEEVPVVARWEVRNMTAWRRVWIFKRELRTRTTYCLRWYDGSNRIRSEAVGPDKRLAEDLRRRRELELNSGRFRDIVPIRFSEFVDEHLRLLEGRVERGTLTTTQKYSTNVPPASVKSAQALLPYGPIVSQSYRGRFSAPSKESAVVASRSESA